MMGEMKAKQVKKSKVRQFIEYSLMGTVFPAVFAVPAFYDDIKNPYDFLQVLSMCLGFGVVTSVIFLRKQGFSNGQKTQADQKQVEPCFEWEDEMRTEAEEIRREEKKSLREWMEKMESEGKYLVATKDELEFRENDVAYLPNQNTPFCGKEQEFFESGKIMEETHFDQGKARYHTAWYEDGGKQEEIYLKEGERHGSYTYWYENGQKQEEGIFKEGKADGICIMYNEKGYDKLETFWKDDEEVIDSP